MEFEWDEEKRRKIWRERRVDLYFAARMFQSPVFTRVDDRRDYGEVRHISVGIVGSEYLVLVHTIRDGKTRLITAWKANEKEKRRYQDSFAR